MLYGNTLKNISTQGTVCSTTFVTIIVCLSVCLSLCTWVLSVCMSMSFLTSTYILCFRKNQSFSGAKSIVYLDLEREKVEKILKKLDNHIIKRDGELFYSNFPSQIFLYRITYWNCI